MTAKRVLSFVFLAFLAACDGIVNPNINVDPNSATEISGDLLLPTALANLASNRAIEIQPDGALFVNLWASTGSASVFLDPERYGIDSFTAGNTWGMLYTSVLKNMALMRDQAMEAEPPRHNVAAQAEILSAYAFWMLTSIWESIPFTQALDAATYGRPEYDDQATVLRGIVERLDEAVALIDEDGPPGVRQGDLMYDGDMAKWRRFAHSLKLRTLMMLRSRDPSVDVQIEALLDQPLIRSNADEAAIPFFDQPENQNNAWKVGNQFGGFRNTMNGQLFYFAGQTLVDMMKGLADPRLDTYFELAVRDFNIAPDGGGHATAEHFGQRAGVSSFNDGRTSMISQNIIRPDWPSRILPAAEVWFHEAEFHVRRGDLAAAHASYVEGVRAAVSYFDGKAGGIAPFDQEMYVQSLPGSFANMAAALNAIHSQQYIEVFDRSPENWTQWRRTKFPALQPAQQAVLGGVIRRFPMPPDEVSSNPNAQVNVGIRLDQPMWFEN